MVQLSLVWKTKVKVNITIYIKSTKREYNQ